MIGKSLAVLALRVEAVALPRFAHFPPGATIARAASFMMHGSQPFSPPAVGEEGDVGLSEEWSKSRNSHTALKFPASKNFHY